jgi:hypothetical protein
MHGSRPQQKPLAPYLVRGETKKDSSWDVASAKLRYAMPRAFYGVPVSPSNAVCSDFRTTRAARGFSHSKAMNAAITSHTIMAQKTFDQEPVLAKSHAAPGPAKAVATPLAVYTMP